ncbi:hypothetical protein HMI54_002997 [Coelomomyces lativittatus]|nr:hypothetical protein HMI54_002997 [Coelomomyces lativittatus]KAJ1509974.1 hypothetical protein HMI55_007182 [Coelomomyces lativittatus]
MTLSKEMSEPPSKIPRIDSNTQRNKRLFGFIKSTLQKANQEQAQLIDTLRKREEILSTAQDRLRREKIEMEKKLRDDKKRQETMDSLKRALKKAQRAVERREYLNFLGHYKHVNDFLLLTSSPPLFWRPAKHTSITKKTLEDQVALRVQRQKVIAKELELRVQECEHELEKFMQDQNESALPEAES